MHRTRDFPGFRAVHRSASANCKTALPVWKGRIGIHEPVLGAAGVSAATPVDAGLLAGDAVAGLLEEPPAVPFVLGGEAEAGGFGGEGFGGELDVALPPTFGARSATNLRPSMRAGDSSLQLSWRDSRS